MAQSIFILLYMPRTLLLSELNAFKFSATMVSMNTLRGVTLLFLNVFQANSIYLYFIAAGAPKWLI